MPAGRAHKDHRFVARVCARLGNHVGQAEEAKSQPPAASVMDTQPVVAGSKGCHRLSMDADKAEACDVGLCPWGRLHFIPGKADKLVQKETHT